MSGIGIALVGSSAAAGPPPEDPWSFDSFDWTGSSPLNVSGASGSTNFPNTFEPVTSGGSGTTSFTYTVTVNPSGKLSLVTLGARRGVAWSGFTINEAQYITVDCFASNSGSGSSATRSATTIIKRVS